jgi:hypothetical protein
MDVRAGALVMRTVRTWWSLLGPVTRVVLTVKLPYLLMVALILYQGVTGRGARAHEAWIGVASIFDALADAVLIGILAPLVLQGRRSAQDDTDLDDAGFLRDDFRRTLGRIPESL